MATRPNDEPQHPGPDIPYYTPSPIFGYTTRPPRPRIIDFEVIMRRERMDKAAADADDRATVEAGEEFGRWLRRYTPFNFSHAVLRTLKAARCEQNEEED